MDYHSCVMDTKECILIEPALYNSNVNITMSPLICEDPGEKEVEKQ